MPVGALLLSGSGDAATFLRDLLVPGATASVQVGLRAGGRPLALAGQALVTGAGRAS